MKKLLTFLPWTLAFFGMVILFTVFKMPDHKIKALIQSEIKNALGPMGIQLNAKETDLSLIFGPEYEMREVEIRTADSKKPIMLDSIRVSPSLFSMITGRIAATTEIRKGSGSVDIDFSGNQKEYDLSFDVDSLDVGELGVLPVFAKIEGEGVLSGRGQISGKATGFSTLDGEIRLILKKMKIKEQVLKSGLAGFKLPEVNISQSKALINIKKGKVKIGTLKIGKPGNKKDDVRAEITGDLQLQRSIRSSKMNLEARFSLSDKVKRSIPLADAILKPGQRPDSSYAFKLAGPLLGPVFPTPLK